MHTYSHTYKLALTHTTKILTFICIIKLMFHVFMCIPTKITDLYISIAKKYLTMHNFSFVVQLC